MEIVRVEDSDLQKIESNRCRSFRGYPLVKVGCTPWSQT
jgi:hypothetical protein